MIQEKKSCEKMFLKISPCNSQQKRIKNTKHTSHTDTSNNQQSNFSHTAFVLRDNGTGSSPTCKHYMVYETKLTAHSTAAKRAASQIHVCWLEPHQSKDSDSTWRLLLSFLKIFVTLFVGLRKKHLSVKEIKMSNHPIYYSLETGSYI